jgi:hypothetical protein
MKKYLVLILLAFIGFTSYAQTSNDADAQAFITACDADPAGKLTPEQKNYITQMVEGMKSIGVWIGSVAIYPMVGGTAFKHKFNLKDPRDLDLAYRLTFLGGGWIHDNNGAKPNGTSSYARTFYIPTYTSQIANNIHLGYSTNENLSTLSAESVMGDNTVASQTRLIIKRSNGTGLRQEMFILCLLILEGYQ